MSKKRLCAVPNDRNWTLVNAYIAYVQVYVESRAEWGDVREDERTSQCEILRRIIETESGGGEGIPAADSYADEQLVCRKCSEVLFNVRYVRK